MKRIPVIAITIVLVLLATTGAAAAAGQKLPPQDRAAQFDVKYLNEVVGTLNINTNAWKFELNAHGLEPGQEYFLYYLGRFPQVCNGTANEDGDLHLAGTWPPNIGVQDPLLPQQLALTDSPLVGYWCDDSILTAKYHPGILKTTIWGSLRNLDGTPIADQWIFVRKCENSVCTFFIPGVLAVKTGADGRFQVSTSNNGKLQVSQDIELEFKDGYLQGTFYCTKTTRAAYSFTGP